MGGLHGATAKGAKGTWYAPANRMRPTIDTPDLDAGLARLGFHAFRPGQREAIDTLLRERRLLLVAPTGGGKSLIYQLPAAVLPGTTLVVSPLIALMHDQVSALEARGLPSTYLASTLGAAELRRRTAALERGAFKLVYVAPERLAPGSFRSILERLDCPLIAVDEAHCISQWGHDFRPEYLQIGEILALMPRSRVLACTATATPVVRDEILERLGLPVETPQLLRGFARPNLAFRVVELAAARERQGHVDALLGECLARPGQARGTAIVYAPTRRTTEEEAARLATSGWRARPYHAGLDGHLREQVQTEFAAGRLEVVVATNAFGMGIDRPDVRCVIHLAPPDSLEAYYQEAGRAGRDGDDAVCLLLLSAGDLPLRRRLIESGGDGMVTDPEVVTHKWNLFLELMRWAEGGACRHDAILRYFGDEEETLEGCGHCDVCQALAEQGPDPGEIATVVRTALCGAARLEGRFGLTAAAKLLRGEKDERVLRARLHETPTFGALARYPEDWIVQLLRRCVTAGWLDFRGGDRPVLIVTPEGREVIHARRPVRMLLPKEQSGGERRERKAERSRGREDRKTVAGGTLGRDGVAPQGGTLDDAGQALFEALRVFRLERARQDKVPPYVIASDRTLRDIALLRPASLQELKLAHGIGPAKAERHGAALLEVVRRMQLRL